MANNTDTHTHGPSCNHSHEHVCVEDDEVELDESGCELDSELDSEPDSKEKEIMRMLKSYEHPVGTEEANKTDVPDINKFLSQLKNMKPNERMNMMNLFTNMAKNNKTFGDHSFRTVSNENRESNRDRLRKLLEQKKSTRKSRKALESLKDKVQDALYELNSKNKNNKNGATVTGANDTSATVTGGTVTGATVTGGTVTGATVTGGTVTGANDTGGESGTTKKKRRKKKKKQSAE
jgi:hypothetical protein